MNEKLLVLGAILLATATFSGCVFYGYDPGYQSYPYDYRYKRYGDYHRSYGPSYGHDHDRRHDYRF